MVGYRDSKGVVHTTQKEAVLSNYLEGIKTHLKEKGSTTHAVNSLSISKIVEIISEDDEIYRLLYEYRKHAGKATGFMQVQGGK